MARSSSTDWIPVFRRQVRDSTTTGWTVTDSRGSIRLEVRDPAHNGSRKQGITLPYPWAPAGCADALLRIRAIWAFYRQGDCTLIGAAQMAESSSSKHLIDWPDAVAAFKQQRMEIEGRTSEKTWRVKYRPVIDAAVALLIGSRPPSNAAELCDAVLTRWEPGSRQRQIMRQNLYAFLRFCIERQNFKACWTPPPVPKETRKAKRIGYPLSDAQILRLLDGIPDDEPGRRWRFAIQLLATYGLRPEELRHLVVKDGTDGPELWCTYRKSTGGHEKTQPRRLHLLLVRDLDGTPQDWNLLARVQISEARPPLGQEGKGGEALATYLKRRTVWQQLKTEAEHAGEELTPYAFRHRYAKQSHAARLPVASIAKAMGHTIDTHLKSYAKFQPDAVADAYKAANTPLATTR
ncbi:tyrosine-type recombinase/integrase [Synechococcus sp. BSF8S]|uniref:tyrosine-type recombinase/integrase n=1 Tax=Synechococcales TaxID=1890424 RepID=UPI00162ABB95|nr:tyrosine-type recombinase/integrase [Synechococcus sp. BSF8S]MBC1265278.1 tyrosine-type recombinase/integrase [Synechococcus sp. BSA11S]